MYIKHQSIQDLISAADIVSVIEYYIPLKKKGIYHQACCPLHEEKSPSFKVNQVKQSFKCYGCGEGGNAITFVMKKDSLDYYEAVKKLAEITAFDLEFETDLTDNQIKAYKQTQIQKKSMRALMAFALEYYQGNKIPETWYKSRGFSLKVLADLGCGLALDGWDNFMDEALAKGFDMKQLVEAGLVKQYKDEKTNKIKQYDVFRNRVLFPIFDPQGNPLHFSGRTLEKGDDIAKYLNGTNTKIYKKSESLYGYYHAYKSIVTEGFVYYVEGAPNCVRLHQEGRKNVVASLGKGLTQTQIELIKKTTTRVVYIPDNDHKVNEETGAISNPGFQSMERNARLFIENGFTVRFLSTELGTDVDEYLKIWSGEKQSKKQWFDSAQDFISDYKLGYALQMEDDPVGRGEVIKELWDIIDSIPDNVVKTMYHTNIKKELPEFAKVKKLVLDESEQLNKKLKQLGKNKFEDFIKEGFTEENGCYVSFKKDKKEEFSNFTMEMLFFVRSSTNPKWIVKLKNQFGYSVVIPIEANAFTSFSRFSEVISSYGNFIFDGSTKELNKVRRKVFYGVKQALQPSYLGWSNLGFWIWSNGIFFKGKFYDADKHGIVQLIHNIDSIKEFKELHKETRIQINEQDFVVNDAEEILKEMNEDAFSQLIKSGNVKRYEYIYLPFSQRLDNMIGDEDDIYGDIRKFKFHKESDPLTFNEWAKQMNLVYGKNAAFMIANVIASLFKDIVFKQNNNWFPIEFHFGEKGTGKSQAMDSEAVLFGHVKPGGINIHAGGSTSTGVQRIIANFQNAIIVLNEYKNNVHPSKVEMLKSFADGAGKLMAKKTMGLETSSMKNRAVPVVGGQDLPTVEAALLSRCNIISWTKENRNREAYDKLKNWEKQGRPTHIVNELLQYRNLFAKNYRPMLDSVSKKYSQEFVNSNKERPDDREILNKATILTAVKTLMDNTDLQFSFDYNDFFMSCMEKTMELQTIQSTSDDIEKFISTVFSLTTANLYQSSMPIKMGVHLMIRKEKEGEKLFLRLRQIYPFYEAACKQRGIIAIGESTIRNYLNKHRYFISNEANTRFTYVENATSSIVLDYAKIMADDLMINIISETAEESMPAPTTF